ncbi:MAG: IS3 family transposase [Clostridia bacterium]|nr:IS3 family transposase [Clostridia bacterium]
MKLKYRVIERFRGRYSIQAMCEVFEVSRSGYYAWRNRQGKQTKDQWLIDLIEECQRLCKQTYGIHRVRRWIQRKIGKVVNVKAILRVMRKLSLLSVVRRRRPYTRYQQAVHKYPNLLNRCFEQTRPNQFWVTDMQTAPSPPSVTTIRSNGAVFRHSIKFSLLQPSNPQASLRLGVNSHASFR